MSEQVTIEWARIGMDGIPRDHYLGRLVEPYVSRGFVSILKSGSEWRVVLNATGSSQDTRSVRYASLDKAFSHVETWTRRHYKRIGAGHHGGHCDFYTYARHCL